MVNKRRSHSPSYVFITGWGGLFNILFIYFLYAFICFHLPPHLAAVVCVLVH